VPVGPDWIHETEYDGYRLRLRQGRAANYPQRPPRAFSRSLLTRANWIGSLVFCINALVSMMKIVAVIAFLLLLPTPLRAGATIVGAGSQSCSAWTNRTKNAIVKGAFESWVMGFVSGLNVSGDREIVGGGDYTAIVAWMDQRCRSRPTDQIGIAALDLAMELAGNAAKR
jgi:hypothetical protein